MSLTAIKYKGIRITLEQCICGSRRMFVAECEGRKRIECSKCGASSGSCSTIAEAAGWWNQMNTTNRI